VQQPFPEDGRDKNTDTALAGKGAFGGRSGFRVDFKGNRFLDLTDEFNIFIIV
jgi:hypothetical protein